MVMKFPAIVLLLAVAACSRDGTQNEGPPQREIVSSEVLALHDYSLADTPNERTALAYLYTAWNDGKLAEARRTYWVGQADFSNDPKGPPPGALKFPSPRYTIRKVISEGNTVAVLALVEGFGIGKPAVTQRGLTTEPKVGDAVVEFMQFAPSGLIEKKWDTIEPMTKSTLDF